MKKEYINVDVKKDKFENIIPTRIYWNNYHKYNIKRIIHSCFSSVDEFEGIRYTVLIGNTHKNIYNSKDRWYVLLKEEREIGELNN